MGFLSWILLGLLAGSIAGLVAGGSKPKGCVSTTAVGIFGALVGGAIATALDIGEIDEFFDLETWLIAIGGSVIVLWALRTISR